jgi:hypothetical protein
LNARLIPALSFTGAAWATVWTEALLTAGCLAALALEGFSGIRRPGLVEAERPRT